MKKAADASTEATMAALGVASRTQVTGVARQIQDLEDRIENLEDKLAELTRHISNLVTVVSGGNKPPA